MYKVVIYPYDQTVKNILRNAHDSIFDIVGLVSPRGWSECGNTVQVGNKKLQVYSEIEEVHERYNSVCLVNGKFDLNYFRYIQPIIKKCEEENLDVFLFRNLEDDELDNVKNIIPNNKLHILYEKYKEIAFRNELFDIHVPVVFIADVFESLNSADVQLNIYNELMRRGYNVSIVSSKREMRILKKADCIPRSLFENKTSIRDKVLLFNQYVKQIEHNERPDIIIVGIPGNLLEISKTIIGDFGGHNYIISRSIAPDYIICNVPCFFDFADKYKNLEMILNCKYEQPIDACNVMPYFLDLAEAEEIGEIEYMGLSKEFVEKQVSFNNNYYYLEEHDEIVRITDNIIKKLSGYGEIELI